MQLTNEFNPIREWAKERGIYEKGSIDTQFQKLLEEVYELQLGIENIIHYPIKEARLTLLPN